MGTLLVDVQLIPFPSSTTSMESTRTESPPSLHKAPSALRTFGRKTLDWNRLIYTVGKRKVQREQRPRSRVREGTGEGERDGGVGVLEVHPTVNQCLGMHMEEQCYVEQEDTDTQARVWAARREGAVEVRAYVSERDVVSVLCSYRFTAI